MKINAEKRNVKEWVSLTSEGRRAKLHGKMWGKVNSIVAVPRRKRVDVNINKINRFSKEGDHVIVPGKVLGIGKMDHSVRITALEYSEGAMEELNRAKCSVVKLKDAYEELGKGKASVKIIK